MPEKKITRKIITKRASTKKEVPAPAELAPEVVEEKAEVKSAPRDEVRKRFCHFCKTNTVPTYTDLANLKRYLTERAKIQPKQRSGACAKHQRGIAKQIKYARHLALLPFVPKV